MKRNSAVRTLCFVAAAMIAAVALDSCNLNSKAEIESSEAAPTFQPTELPRTGVDEVGAYRRMTSSRVEAEDGEIIAVEERWYQELGKVRFVAYIHNPQPRPERGGIQSMVFTTRLLEGDGVTSTAVFDVEALEARGFSGLLFATELETWDGSRYQSPVYSCAQLEVRWENPDWESRVLDGCRGKIRSVGHSGSPVVAPWRQDRPEQTEFHPYLWIPPE